MNKNPSVQDAMFNVKKMLPTTKIYNDAGNPRLQYRFTYQNRTCNIDMLFDEKKERVSFITYGYRIPNPGQYRVSFEMIEHVPVSLKKIQDEIKYQIDLIHEVNQDMNESEELIKRIMRNNVESFVCLHGNHYAIISKDGRTFTVIINTKKQTILVDKIKFDIQNRPDINTFFEE